MNIEKVFFSGDVSAHLGLVRLVACQVRREAQISVGEVRKRLLIADLASNAPALGSTISVASKIGFFEVSGSVGDEETELSMGGIDLADTSQPSVALAFVSALMAHSKESLSSTEPHLSDLTAALVWLTAQDPSRPFASWGASDGTDPEKAIQDTGLSDVVQGPTQWNALRRWAHQLGFGSLASHGQTIYLTADPTACFHRAIGTFADSSSTFSGRQFFDRLKQALPVMSGGLVNESFRAVRPRIPMVDSDVTLAETHALFRLQATNQLRLRSHDDAEPERALSLGSIRGRLGVVSDVEVARRD